VVYGSATDPVALQVPSRELARTLSTAGSSSLITLQVEGEAEPRMTLVRDVQRHVTRLTITHADLLEVVMDQIVRSEVHLVFEGEPELVAQREAMLEQDISSLSVEALPADLPSSILIDCLQLQEIGDSITVADLIGSGKYDILNDPDTSIIRLAHISRVAEEEEEELEEGELLEGEIGEDEIAEPEVITARGGDEEPE
jgi:large subunit ribosomal protein L25